MDSKVNGCFGMSVKKKKKDVIVKDYHGRCWIPMSLFLSTFTRSFLMCMLRGS